MSASIKLALRPAVREYVRNLEAQNAKLQKEIARLFFMAVFYKDGTTHTTRYRCLPDTIDSRAPK